MKILVSWLREFVEVPVPVRELADVLQSCGFEVAAVDAMPGPPTASPEDGVIDLEVTTNRPDCLNVQGHRARGVHARRSMHLALRGRPDRLRRSTSPEVTAKLPLRVVIEDNEQCPRYAATMADVTHRPLARLAGGAARGVPACARSTTWSTSPTT